MGTIAAIVAAIAAVYGIREQRTHARRQRLVEMAHLVAEIKACILWGSTSAVRRDTAQGRLRVYIGDLKLQATTALAYATLKSDDESAGLATAAAAELHRDLGATRALRRFTRGRLGAAE